MKFFRSFSHCSVFRIAAYNVENQFGSAVAYSAYWCTECTFPRLPMMNLNWRPNFFFFVSDFPSGCERNLLVWWEKDRSWPGWDGRLSGGTYFSTEQARCNAMMITFFGALSFLLSSSVVMAQWWWCTEGCHLKVFYLSSLLALEQKRTESSVVALIGIWSGLKASLLTEGMALILTTIIILCRHRGKKRCERISCYLVVERFDEKHATSWRETI